MEILRCCSAKTGRVGIVDRFLKISLLYIVCLGFPFWAAACAEQAGKIPDDRIQAGLSGSVERVERLDFEAVVEGDSLVPACDEPLTVTQTQYSRGGVMLEERLTYAVRAGGMPERVTVVWTDESGFPAGREVRYPGAEGALNGEYTSFYEYRGGYPVREVQLFGGDAPEDGDGMRSREIRSVVSERGRRIYAECRSLADSTLLWSRETLLDASGRMLEETDRRPDGTVTARTVWEYGVSGRLERMTVGYLDAQADVPADAPASGSGPGVSWVEEVTEYAYAEDGRLVRERTGFAGTDYYVETRYLRPDSCGNWTRSEVADCEGVPFAISLRRIAYFR